MKKILIVDDEPVVREHLKQMIDWSQDVVLIGEASSGSEALKLCREESPDIIFSDIKMPNMDGLQFIERLKKVNPGIKAVLLTAYSDFQYMQDAIDLKVEKYVLKYEMDAQKINDVLRDLCRKIDEENRRESKQSVLRKLLYEKHSSREAREMLYRVGIEWNAAGVYLCCMDHAGDTEFRAADTSLKNEGVRAEYRWVSGDSVVLFVGKDPEQEKNAKSAVRRLAQELQEVTFIETDEPVLLERVQQAFARIRKVKEMPLFFAGKNLVSTALLNSVRPLVFEEDVRETAALVKGRKYEEAIGKIRKLLGEKAVKSCDAEGVNACIDRLLGEILGELSRLDPDFSYSEALEVFKRVHGCTDMQQIIEIVAQQIGKIERMVVLGRKMYIVLEYIDRNFQQDITLEEAAGQVSWNAAYLSQMFRKEMNMTFKQYVNQLRIEKAKTLLADGRLSVEQIAEQIGYSNANYFYKVFKSKTGKKPRGF